MTRNPEIYHTLVFLAEEAAAGQVEALFTVDVRRHNDGRPFTTVHLMCEMGDADQVTTITMHLEGIAEVMRQIYARDEVIE